MIFWLKVRLAGDARLLRPMPVGGLPVCGSAYLPIES
jgi:hypothetical protein